MTLSNTLGLPGRALAIGGALLGLVGMTAAPRPALAVDPGAAAGIGLGAFAAGTMLGQRPTRTTTPTTARMATMLRRRRLIRPPQATTHLRPTTSRGTVGMCIPDATTPARPVAPASSGGWGMALGCAASAGLQRARWACDKNKVPSGAVPLTVS